MAHARRHDPLHLIRGPLPFRAAMAAEFLRRITCPVLLVTGAESDFGSLSEEIETRCAAFSDVTAVTLLGAGHMMQRHQPQALAEILGEFLVGPL